MITNRTDLISFTTNLLGASSDKVSIAGFTQAASQTELELKFVYPVTDERKSYWMVERMRRHLLYILMVESAHKFLLHFEEITANYRLSHICD